MQCMVELVEHDAALDEEMLRDAHGDPEFLTSRTTIQFFSYSCFDDSIFFIQLFCRSRTRTADCGEEHCGLR